MHQPLFGTSYAYYSRPLLAAVPTISTEVCENIIDKVYSTSSIVDRGGIPDGILTLRSCALVCRAWRSRSQRMLFYRVWLSNSTSFDRLSVILDVAQHLRSLVHEVVLNGHHLHTTASIFPRFPSTFGRRMPNLQRVDIEVFPLMTGSSKWFPRTVEPLKAKLPLLPSIYVLSQNCVRPGALQHCVLFLH